MAGRLKFYQKSWSRITNDSHILESIAGYRIPFICKPSQHTIPRKVINAGNLDKYIEALENLLNLGAISECRPHKNQFISSYFLVPKSDGGSRFVLNLKCLNNFLSPSHFKLEDYRTVRNLVSRSSYMTSIDLKDAYFAIPIYRQHRKYLRFIFEGKTYQFN